MAQGSPSSPTLFFGTINTEDNMEFMTNSQHNHHLVDPMNQINQSEVPYPDPDVDYAIRVSPNTLLNSERHVCEVCNKGFARKQNLTLHQRTHNLPFTPKKKTLKNPVPRKVYLCPEPTCIHYNRANALGDFGGLRKHYLRKHYTQKDYKCDNCCKAYSVETDLKAHLKICGTRKYNCHCDTCFSREYRNAPEQVGATKYPQTLNMGDSSINSNNNSISSIMSPLPMFGMGDSSIGFNVNENNYNLTGPQFSTLQNQSNYYHSVPPYNYHFSQFGEDHNGFMTIPSTGLNISNNHPTSFSLSSTQPNQHESQMKTDMDFYADLLRGNIPLDAVNYQNHVNMKGDGGTSYATGEGSNLFSDGGNMYDPSSSLNMTPAMHNTSQNGMLNPEIGIGNVGSYGNSSYNGYGYGDGSGHFGYEDGTKAHNYETSAATAGVVAPPEPHLNQDRFWF